MSDLMQALQAVSGESDLGTREGWHVIDRASAQWAMQKIYELTREAATRHDEADKVRAPLEAQLSLVNAWEKQEINTLEASKQFFEGELIHWLAVERAANPDLKSIKLAHGTVASRQKPDGIEITDEAAVIALAKANGWTEFIRVKEELAKSAVKEAVLKEGQVIEGVRKVEGERVYEVKVAAMPDGA